MLRRVLIAMIVLGGGFTTVTWADVYRWVDGSGVTHYSDQWVPGSEIIKTGKPHPSNPNVVTGDQKSLTATSRSIDKELTDQANARATATDVARTQAAQCEAAKDRYNKAIQSRRIYKDGSDGEREYLSDADAESYREQARKDVQSRCGNVPEFAPDQVLNPQPQALNPQPQALSPQPQPVKQP